jgi:phytoene desaturase
MWTRVSPSYSETPVAHVTGRDDQRPHAVIIGSGFGGLAAAIRLGARGYRVTVLEKLEQPGGRASVFRQDGFTFDAGPTIITLPGVFEELWALTGRRFADDVDLRALDPFYKLIFNDGSHLDCSGDHEAMRREVSRLSPGDLDGYERFMDKTEAIYRFAFEDLGQKHFSDFSEMLKALPGFIRHRADRSIYTYAARHMKDERLRIAFSFHPLFIGGNPFSVTSLYALVSYLERKYGVHFAMGGTGAIVTAMVKLIEKHQGNRVICNSPVANIMLENGAATGVRLASGEEIRAAVVVSNADAPTTYTRLLPASHQRRRWTPAKIARTKFSMSLFVWYFGTKKRYDNVDHHSILLGPRYKDLLHDIFKKKVLAKDFSLYIHRPTATDPSLAPEGCDTFYALSPVPHLESGTDWATMAEPYRKAIEKRLSETLLPGLESNIVTSKIFTPIDFRDRLSSHHGAAFSAEPLMFQSAWFRAHNRSEEVKNLYLVGAGTHPGAGVPGVIVSARILDQIVPHATAHAQP